jgi:2-methylisocitrate lyase-like PEP mutase family enzyme
MAFSLGLAEGQVSRDETLKHCRSIVEATALPVSADLERGFGHSPQSAAETIRPNRWRVSHAITVAASLLTGALEAPLGVHIRTNDNMT